MGVAEQEVLLDDDLIERDFNEALNDLQKSLKSTGSLSKAKRSKSKDYDEEDDAETEVDVDVEVEEEDEEEDDDDMEKSLSDIISEDPEAAAAIEISDFLGQLVKAIDESVAQMGNRVRNVEKLVKSQARMAEQTAILQKSTRDMVKQIGGQPVASNSVKRLEKSRFETPEGEKDFDNNAVLIKSRDWVRTGKLDLNEAGMIEGRINKGRLGRVNDRLDQKVAALMREDD